MRVSFFFVFFQLFYFKTEMYQTKTKLKSRRSIKNKQIFAIRIFSKCAYVSSYQ